MAVLRSNPYATSRNEAEFGQPEYAASQRDFAVPEDDSRRHGYTLSPTGAWSPSLRLSPEGLPDATRVGTFPVRDMRPVPNRPSVERWNRMDAETAQRHSVETQDADGWVEQKGSRRFADHPESIRPPEPRPTQQMSPSRYSFVRPFMHTLPKHGNRYFNGLHFSMADHRRTYDILGMAPPRAARTTYRLDPKPWDTNVVDMPPDTDYVPDATITSREVPLTTNRSWRL